MSVNALLAKAMSTDSDEEAMSAFRMARKKNKGATIEVNLGSDTQWKAKAREFHDAAVTYRDRYNATHKEAMHFHKMASDYFLKNTEYRLEIVELKRTIRKLEAQNGKISPHLWKYAFFLVTALNILIVGLVK